MQQFLICYAISYELNLSYLKGIAMNKHMIEEKISNWYTSKKPYGNIILHAHCENSINLKNKISFVCVSCDTGKTGLWKMQLNNVLNGIGCPVCKSIDEVKSLFHNSILRETHNIKSINEFTEYPNVSLINYRVKNHNESKSNIFTRSGLIGYIKSYEYQFKSDLEQEGQKKCIQKRFIEQFADGFISYYGSRLEGTTTPGPYFSIRHSEDKIITLIALQN